MDYFMAHVTPHAYRPNYLLNKTNFIEYDNLIQKYTPKKIASHQMSPEDSNRFEYLTQRSLAGHYTFAPYKMILKSLTPGTPEFSMKWNLFSSYTETFQPSWTNPVKK